MGGQPSSMNKVNFEDIQWLIEHQKSHLLINTLKKENQQCLIKGTIPIDKEENIINSNLKRKDIKIIIYGRNTNDEQIIKKFKQLYLLGFYHIFVYPGGLFEWLCLQDIYGGAQFPTTRPELDILKFKPPPQICNFNLIKDGFST